MPRLRTWRRSQGSHSSETWTQYVVQPTQCINQLSSWEGKTFRKKVQKTLQRQRPDSDETQTSCVAGWGALLTPPFECFCAPEGQKLPKHDKNQQGSRHSLFECVYQIWGLYIIFKAMDVGKLLWPIFGCKVSQSILIGLKLELDVWYHPLDVYAKFQTNISQHVQKMSGKLFACWEL